MRIVNMAKGFTFFEKGTSLCRCVYAMRVIEIRGNVIQSYTEGRGTENFEDVRD